MSNNRILIIIVTLLVILIASLFFWRIITKQHKEQPLQPQQTETLTLNGIIYKIDAPPADPKMVGKWQGVDNLQWYKVYYDDYDTDGFYWGKEWNEADDVHEEDLLYHGNGWFRWKKHKKELLESPCQDDIEVPITTVYIVRHKGDSMMQLTEKYVTDKSFRFSRAK